jgi:hypothetical protein
MNMQPVHQLKISLLEVEPSIWRRLQVDGSLTLERLHTVIQKAMGWQNAHLYEFEVRGRRYGVPEPDEPEYDVEPVWKITLREAAPVQGTSFRYVYDLGDGWTHEILAERIETPDEQLRHPVCVAGERRCPPEDCGGPGGYEELLTAIRDPDHPAHDDMVRWVGRGFDPEPFDLAGVNRKLRLLR